MNKLEQKVIRLLQREIDNCASQIEDAKWSLEKVEGNKELDPAKAIGQLEDGYKSLQNAHGWINALKNTETQ